LGRTGFGIAQVIDSIEKKKAAEYDPTGKEWGFHSMSSKLVAWGSTPWQGIVFCWTSDRPRLGCPSLLRLDARVSGH
jgi:hypothetical protein